MTTDTTPLIFLMGATGQTGRLILKDLDQSSDGVRIRFGVRKQEDLERFRSEGRDAVLFDLDDPKTLGPALCGVDRMNILTGYTIAMTHQTKWLVDAAKKAGVRHIVNQGVFAAATTAPTPSSHGSAWSRPTSSKRHRLDASPSQHVHGRDAERPPPKGGSFPVFWGDERVGYIALQDLAAVTAKVLREGPGRHAGKDYYLSTETMTGSELATMLGEVLGKKITCDVRHPKDMENQFKSGSREIEDWYARSSIEFCTQLSDGRMGYIGTVRDDVPYLLGRPATTFREWRRRTGWSC